VAEVAGRHGTSACDGVRAGGEHGEEDAEGPTDARAAVAVRVEGANQLVVAVYQMGVVTFQLLTIGYSQGRQGGGQTCELFTKLTGVTQDTRAGLLISWPIGLHACMRAFKSTSPQARKQRRRQADRRIRNCARMQQAQTVSRRTWPSWLKWPSRHAVSGNRLSPSRICRSKWR